MWNTPWLHFHNLEFSVFSVPLPVCIGALIGFRSRLCTADFCPVAPVFGLAWLSWFSQYRSHRWSQTPFLVPSETLGGCKSVDFGVDFSECLQAYNSRFGLQSDFVSSVQKRSACSACNVSGIRVSEMMQPFVLKSSTRVFLESLDSMFCRLAYIVV